MNITDFIVKHLQEGKSVEIPGIGTLTPIGQQITLRNVYCNDKSIVKYIAEKECVNESIADMMWKNYVDALSDKLAHSGSHVFEGAGELTLSNGTYGFKTAMVKPTIEDAIESQVMGSVKKYTKDDEEDPFNVFEQPIRDDITGTHGSELDKTVEQNNDEHDIITTVYEAHMQQSSDAKQESQGEVAKPVAETESSSMEKGESVVESKPVEHEVPNQEPMNAHAEEARQESIKQNEASDEVKRDLLSTPLDSKKDRKSRERKERKEKKAAKKLEKKVKYRSSNVGGTKQEKKKRKKGLWILIILLIILLLGIGCGVYYHFFMNKPVAELDPNATPKMDVLSVPAENDFTTNQDLIEYTVEERWDEVVGVCSYMEDYIGNYLNRMGYGKAKDEMMVRVETYVNTRIDTLLSTNSYSVRRFIPYEDYLYNAFYDELKDRKSQNARVKVQTELMNMGVLRELLDAMVLELGLVSDRKVAVAQDEDLPLPKVSTEKRSKHGFDIVAGFYTNYKSAVRMTASLKKWGCDAYVIEKNSGYYVSMGSAKTRTAAEALLTHIKSWYDGDVVIKQVD